MNVPFSLPPGPDRPVLITGPFVLVFSSFFFFGLAFWPYVLLPAFLQDLGATLPVVGLIMGIAPFSGILARPWVGPALDRVGRKKILLAGGVVFLAANLLYLRIDALGGLIYAVRLLHGLGLGVLMATFFTLAADLSPDSRLTEGIALFGVSGHVSAAVGVAMGEQILRTGGFHAVFWTTSALAFVSMVLAVRIAEPPPHPTGTPGKGFMNLMAAPSLRLPMIATAIFALSIASYMVFLKPYARSAGIDSVTPFFVAYSLTAVAVRLIGGSWPDRFGLLRVAYPAMSSMFAGLVLLTVVPSMTGLVGAGILCGFGHGFLFPIFSVMIIGAARTADRGARMTLFTMVFDMGLFVGPPLLGWIGRGGHYQAIFILAAAVQIANILAFALSGRKKRE